MWVIDSSLQGLNIKLRYWRALEIVINARCLSIDALPFANKQWSFWEPSLLSIFLLEPNVLGGLVDVGGNGAWLIVLNQLRFDSVHFWFLRLRVSRLNDSVQVLIRHLWLPWSSFGILRGVARIHVYLAFATASTCSARWRIGHRRVSWNLDARSDLASNMNFSTLADSEGWIILGCVMHVVHVSDPRIMQMVGLHLIGELFWIFTLCRHNIQNWLLQTSLIYWLFSRRIR